MVAIIINDMYRARGGQSYFYNGVFQNFVGGRYDEALQSVMRYNTGGTSSSAYRKVYNMIVPVLDRIIRKGRLDPNDARDLVRLNIVLEYQKNRRLIHGDLADGIKDALNDIRNNAQQARRFAEALRDSLDAILAYKFTAERKKEGEEYL